VAYDINDQVEIEAGVRYTEYATDQTTDYTFGLGDSPPVIPFASGKQDLDESSVDGQVAVNWKVLEDHFLYALFSRGHVSSGINIFPPYREYDEMDVRNYEIGWKARWLDDRLRTQATVYHLDFHDYQVNFESQDVVIGQDNRNAPGSSKIWGAELSSQAHIDNFYFDLAVAYMTSDIGDFDDVIDPFTGEPTNLSGRRTPYSPKVTFNSGVAYDFFLGDAMGGLRLTPRVDVSYVSDTQSKLWDTPLVEISQRTLVNTRLVLAAPNDKWTAAAWMTNALDQEYVTGIQNLATLYYAGRPREYGLKVTYNLD
jgi:iron complex outermembrane receptor protein